MADSVEAKAKADEAKLGRPRGTFSRPVIAKILELLQEGHGRASVCEELRIGYHRFLREMQEDPDFAGWVLVAEASRVESCEVALLNIVRSGQHTPLVVRAAVAYLARRDRLDEARRARKAKRDASSPRKPEAGELGV